MPSQNCHAVGVTSVTPTLLAPGTNSQIPVAGVLGRPWDADAVRHRIDTARGLFCGRVGLSVCFYVSVDYHMPFNRTPTK